MNKKIREIEHQITKFAYQKIECQDLVINEITRTLYRGELALASHEIWRAGVEVEVLDHKLQVLISC